MPEAKATPAGNQAATVVKQLKELWRKQPKGRRTLAVLVVLGVLGFVAITSITKHTESWTNAAEGVSPADMQTMYSLLVARGIPARIKDGKVEVHDADVDQAHAIAMMGNVVSGDDDPLKDIQIGTTSGIEQVKIVRALQLEIAHSITSIAQVESARVQLALGHRSPIKDQAEAPTASVTLRLRPGQSLTSDQVKGIRQLVAGGVTGLKPEAVGIIDGHGNLLDGSMQTAGTTQADLERSTSARVRTMLERVVGPGHVSVVATADFDNRKISQTEDTYDKDNTAIRSQARTIDGVDPSQGSASGIAGVRGNLPGSTPAATGAGAAAGGKMQETINYEVSHKIVQTTNPDQTLKKLHVAVLIDQKTGADGKPIKRTKDQVAELVAIATQAAGIDEARGDAIEVREMQFAPEEDMTSTSPAAAASALPPMPVLVGAGAGALVLLVVIALVLRKVLKKKSKTTALVRQGQIAFPTPVAELERVLDARPSIELPVERELPSLAPGRSVQERVMETVRGDVERAAGVLTAWLHEAPPKGAK